MSKLTGYEYETAILDLVYKYKLVVECKHCGYPKLKDMLCDRCYSKGGNLNGICQDREQKWS